jgi:hypothetical protein
MLTYLASSGTIVAMASVAAVDEGESDKEVADHFFFNTSLRVAQLWRWLLLPLLMKASRTRKLRITFSSTRPSSSAAALEVSLHQVFCIGGCVQYSPFMEIESAKNVAQKKRVEATLTRDMKFICDATELGLPCLPVC